MVKKAVLFLITLTLTIALGGCGKGDAAEDVTFSATVLEISGSSALVSPLEDETEIRSSSDKISFSTSELEDIGAAPGDMVSITFNGEIRESYPAGITAKSWRIVEKAQTPPPEQTQDPGEANEQPSGQLYALFSEDRRDYKTDEGSLLLSFGYTDTQINIIGAQEASDAINTALSDIKRSFTGGGQQDAGINGMLSDADKEYEALSDNPDRMFYYYSLERAFTVGRLDGRIISLRAQDYIYKGGARGSSFGSGVVFDAVSGKRLGLADIGEDYRALVDFSSSYIAQLAGEDENADYWYDDYVTTLGAVVSDNNWYFDEKGLVFICDPGLIGPHFTGGLEFTVPYGELKGLLREKYMPAQKNFGISAGPDIAHIAYEGAVDTQSFNSLLDHADSGLAAEPRCIIWFDETVSDVRLEPVTYLGYADDFEPSGVLFAANSMSPDSALRWACVLPEGMPDTRLVYTLGSGVKVTRYVSYNGRTGEPTLTQYRSEIVTVELSVEGETISKEYRRYGTALFETVYDPEELWPSEDPESGLTRFYALSGAALELDIYPGVYTDYQSGAREERRHYEDSGFTCSEIVESVVGEGYTAARFSAYDDLSIRTVWVIKYEGSHSDEDVSCVVFAAKMPTEYADGWGPRFAVMLGRLMFR